MLALKALTTFFVVSVATAQPVVVAALGDSLTAGYGLPQEEGFVPVLQGWLSEQGAEVELRNAGVSGDTTAGGLSRVEWTLTEDVDALIVELGGNDMLRGVDPAASRGNLDGILKAAEARDLPVLLVGLAASGNFGPDYKAAFDAMYPELAETYGTLLYPDFFAVLTGREDQAAARRELMQGDGIHPSAEGVRLIVQDIGPRVLELIERVE
ncbi:acyl-CoA thioesterase-1 [Vannielia litorea]|uniref:Acyl-CoA thioesterase-1 n=1 Tax=Vannielia litorea TaxID=1217970 RepID=A0A1N6IF70_9RHOB|nr:acyl-CoA thioesterase-1 [Vannielia litorea]